MPTAYTLDAFSLENLSTLTELATQAAAEQVAICDKAEALGWDYIGRDSDRSTTVTINQKKCVFIPTAATTSSSLPRIWPSSLPPVPT